MKRKQHPTSLPELRRAVLVLENNVRACRDLLAVQTNRALALKQDFTYRRTQILKLAASKYRRHQNSKLSLQITTSGELKSPRIVWKRISWLRKREGDAPGKSKFFTYPIPKGKRHGWKDKNLARLAHPDEIGLVLEIEAQLTKIRTDVAPLAVSGTRLLAQLYHAKKRLEKASTAPRARAAKRAAAIELDQIPMFPGEPIPSQRMERPQFRKPRR